MNKIVKKVSAIALAFTMLGTGATITKAVAPKSNTALTASAASTCQHHGYSYRTSSNWEYHEVWRYVYLNGTWWYKRVRSYESRTIYIKCGSCDKTINSFTETRNERTY